MKREADKVEGVEEDCLVNGGQAVAREKFLHKRKVKQSSCYKIKTRTGCLVEA